jgi:hypothetical protein
MKNKFKIPALLFASLSLSFASCSDWTDPESVHLDEPDITTQNPALYQKYLQALREYKNSEHSKVYWWFDNSQKNPESRLQHINALPDSVDVISLVYPDNLADWELQEMAEVRKDKGTKVIYTVDYDAIKAVYDARTLEAENDTTIILPPYNDYLVDTLETSLSYVKKYNFDGICVSYNGKFNISMTPSELAVFTQNERTFMGIMNDWAERNSDKIFTLKGNPQYLLDPSIFTKFGLMIVPCDNATNADAFTLNLEQASYTPGTEDKLGVYITGPKAVDDNKEVGYMSDGRTRLQGLIEWFPRHHSVRPVAAGIYSPAGDYFSLVRLYNDSRTLITTINPPVK